MPECPKKVCPASAFLPIFRSLSPASTIRHQGQSGTAGHGLVRHYPAMQSTLFRVFVVSLCGAKSCTLPHPYSYVETYKSVSLYTKIREFVSFTLCAVTDSLSLFLPITPSEVFLLFLQKSVRWPFQFLKHCDSKLQDTVIFEGKYPYI